MTSPPTSEAQVEPASVTIELGEDGRPCGYTLCFETEEQFEALDRVLRRLSELHEAA